MKIIGSNYIRTGLVWNDKAGLLITCEPQIESETAHANLVLWNNGSITESHFRFNAHAICRVDTPSPAVIIASEDGFFAINSTQLVTGNIFEQLIARGGRDRFGSIRSLRNVSGTVYAVGLRGTAVRLASSESWTECDVGLPSSFDGHAIDGFNSRALYAVGSNGQIWNYDGSSWTEIPSPTNVTLTGVKCAPDGNVYIVGHNGMVVKGNQRLWTVIEQNEVTDDIWGIEWFDNSIFVSTFSRVYRLIDDSLIEVDFHVAGSYACYQLSAVNRTLWSIGERDVFSYDGAAWKRIV